MLLIFKNTIIKDHFPFLRMTDGFKTIVVWFVLIDLTACSINAFENVICSYFSINKVHHIVILKIV